MSMGASPSGDDENVVAAPDHLEPLQSQPPVADAFAGFELVLVAVPGTDEMPLVGERLPLIAAVRRDHVDHPVDHQALAGRPAGMDAVVAVGEIVAVLVEHADLRLPGDDDAPVAVPHFRRLGDEAFRHGLSSLARMLPRPWTGGAWLRRWPAKPPARRRTGRLQRADIARVRRPRRKVLSTMGRSLDRRSAVETDAVGGAFR